MVPVNSGQQPTTATVESSDLVIAPGIFVISQELTPHVLRRGKGEGERRRSIRSLR